MPHRCSIACIIPPVLLEELVRRGGDRAERDSALRTLVGRRRAAHRPRAQFAGRRGRQRDAVLQSVTPASPRARSSTARDRCRRRTRRACAARASRASDDVAVNEAYDGLGDTYGFYWDAVPARLDRRRRACPCTAWVHYGDDYDNAFWDGSEMVFGDGDGMPSTASPSRSTSSATSSRTA